MKRPLPAEDAPGEGLLARLRRSGLLTRKALGQHFLTDPTLLCAMAGDAEILPSESVFEVGTGPGTLTAELARRAARVLTVEVDASLQAFAREGLREFGNVEYVCRDVLGKRGQLDEDVSARLRSIEPFVWVSNLPYGIASPLIVTLLESGLHWSRASVLVQAEVGERLVAEPGTKEFGPLTLLVAFWASGELGRRIAPGAFSPPPRVESRVIRLTPHVPLGTPEVYFQYRGWVRRLFSGRRKQLGGLLRRALGERQARSALEEGGWDPLRRPESLAAADFLTLARAFPIF
ncbi:MAG TPA: 16S rRNA (adenine(1518)-N(6)/adenine(1519)-N(6))-dimethyltransferase RsmA [Planctomycetota bacterium]|nr:16S rRNA (adenine(1518)-N(6)/adenine(1519)-N(6))-dimethyltransferase RsmA [Planctomycetota bacterium]